MKKWVRTAMKRLQGTTSSDHAEDDEVKKLRLERSGTIAITDVM